MNGAEARRPVVLLLLPTSWRTCIWLAPRVMQALRPLPSKSWRGMSHHHIRSIRLDPRLCPRSLNSSERQSRPS